MFRTACALSAALLNAAASPAAASDWPFVGGAGAELILHKRPGARCLAGEAR